MSLLSSVTAGYAHAPRYRCPMECTMSSDATSWSCIITLRMGVDNNDRERKPTTVPFGQTITDRSEVEVWLRRAQTAILNPNVPSSSFYTKTVEELRNMNNALKFSRNVVCVSIKDPDATDLSFYDLPGKCALIWVWGGISDGQQRFDTKRRSRHRCIGEKLGGTLHQERQHDHISHNSNEWYVYELQNRFVLN